jgi:hypothetical protein
MKLTASLARTLLLPSIIVASLAIPALPAQAQVPDQIRIDVPVMLKQAKVVFNMDHAGI